MTETPTDDRPGLVAEKPEHCHACYRLMLPGQTYYLTVGQAVLCNHCITDHDAIRVTDDLTVVVEDGQLLVRRGGSTVEVLPSEVRCLVDAPCGQGCRHPWDLPPPGPQAPVAASGRRPKALGSADARLRDCP